MTEKEFWEKVNASIEKGDLVQLRSLLQSYPQYVGESKKAYVQQLQEDVVFRAEEDAKAARLKEKLLAELGEDWVKENWKD